VDETLNRTPNQAAPYVGSSAFAHKGGLHVAAMERSPLSYQHIEPTLVGNEKRILVSELSGRQNIMGKIEEVGLDWGEVTNKRAMAILNRVKALESKGYSFEGADASVHLMILHATKGYCPPFKVLDYAANVYDSNMDSASRVLSWNEKENDKKKNAAINDHGPTARATVKVRTISVRNILPGPSCIFPLAELPRN
jgi:2-isopropylmalate synthase